MPHPKLILRDAFERELAAIRRLLRGRRVRREQGVGVPSRTKSECRQAEPVPTVTPRPASQRRVRSRRRFSLAAWLLSGLLHGALLASLLWILIPEDSPPASPSGMIVSLRRLRPASPPPSRPEPPKKTQSSTDDAARETSAPKAPAETPAPARPQQQTSPRQRPPPALRRTLGLGAAPPLPQREPTAGDALATVSSLGDRRTQGKGHLLQRYGGGAGTEDAVSRGLRWLAAHQDQDGGWSAEGFSKHCGEELPCPGAGIEEFDVGVSALASLAFLGAGQLHAAKQRRGHPRQAAGSLERPYRDVAERSLSYLLAAQEPDGSYGPPTAHQMYNHSLATLALAEAFVLTQKPIYRDSVRRAVELTTTSQRRGGGWDYSAAPSDRNDLSVTGWQAMALAAAERAGIRVPSETMERLRSYLSTSFTRDGIGIYSDRGADAGRRGINMVAVGMLSTLLTGNSMDQRLNAGRDRLLRRPPDWSQTSRWESTYQSYYYWYTASLALFLYCAESQPKKWAAWNHALQRELLPHQDLDGHVFGSWKPERSWVGVTGGRVCSTALCVLTLETYYRYEPLASLRGTQRPPTKATATRRRKGGD